MLFCPPQIKCITKKINTLENSHQHLNHLEHEIPGFCFAFDFWYSLKKHQWTAGPCTLFLLPEITKTYIAHVRFKASCWKLYMSGWIFKSKYCTEGIYSLQGSKLRLIPSPMWLTFSPWRLKFWFSRHFGDQISLWFRFKLKE